MGLVNLWDFPLQQPTKSVFHLTHIQRQHRGLCTVVSLPVKQTKEITTLQM